MNIIENTKVRKFVRSNYYIWAVLYRSAWLFCFPITFIDNLIHKIAESWHNTKILMRMDNSRVVYNKLKDGGWK